MLIARSINTLTHINDRILVPLHTTPSQRVFHTHCSLRRQVTLSADEQDRGVMSLGENDVIVYVGAQLVEGVSVQDTEKEMLSR